MAIKYLYIDEDSTRAEIIPDFDPTVPGIPATKRYAADFLAKSV